MDISDKATEQEEKLRAQEIAKARAARPGPTWTGFCLNCDEPTDEPRRWCCADCRDDWEKRHG